MDKARLQQLSTMTMTFTREIDRDDLRLYLSEVSQLISDAQSASNSNHYDQHTGRITVTVTLDTHMRAALEHHASECQHHIASEMIRGCWTPIDSAQAMLLSALRARQRQRRVVGRLLEELERGE